MWTAKPLKPQAAKADTAAPVIRDRLAGEWSQLQRGSARACIRGNPQHPIRHSFRPRTCSNPLSAHPGRRQQRKPGIVDSRRVVPLCQEFLHEPPADVGQSEVASHVPIGESLVIKPHQMQECRLEVMDVHRILDNVEA